ncbi:hypothetical protein [Pradoshia sp.]
MKRYIKLVNLEVARVTKVLLGGLAATFIIQMIGVWLSSNRYMEQVNELIMDGENVQSILNNHLYYMSMQNFSDRLYFIGPIALCAGAVFFYIFLIWYRDWSGKNTFIYRLLMLPTARLSVYFSKATALMLIIFTMVAAQIVFLKIESTFMDWLIPTEFFKEISIAEIANYNLILHYVIPGTITEFILYYGGGFIILTILFTAILMERSFRWKGLLLGLVYIAASLLLSFSPIFTLVALDKVDYFYTSELAYMFITSSVIAGAVSVWISHYLLNKKVTV